MALSPARVNQWRTWINMGESQLITPDDMLEVLAEWEAQRAEIARRDEDDQSKREAYKRPASLLPTSEDRT